MMVLDSLILSFFLQCCFFYTLLQSLDPMEQDCFLAYKKEKHYRVSYRIVSKTLRRQKLVDGLASAPMHPK